MAAVGKRIWSHPLPFTLCQNSTYRLFFFPYFFSSYDRLRRRALEGVLARGVLFFLGAAFRFLGAVFFFFEEVISAALSESRLRTLAAPGE